MIPATQRPDGTWRKARKIRAGFNSSSGGATRYVPPAFRNTAGGSDKDGDGREGYGHARSLSEVAATDGRGGTRRFLDAAIFLLTVKTSAPPATAQIENEGGKGEGSGSGGGSRAGGMALRLPLRSAARAAKETLGCNGCRTLSPEPRPATAVHVTAAAALADIATGPEQPESSDDDQERGKRDTTSSSDDWWARLRQVEQGWISSEADFHDGSRRDEESWIGLHLKLRPSDVHCLEGRIAIVDFLKGRLGKQVVGRDDDDDDDEEKEEEEHAEGGENDNTSLLKETHPQDVTKPADPTPSPAVTNIPTAVGGEEESGESGLPSSSKRSGSNNSNSSNEQRSPRAIGTIMDAVEGQESGPQAAEGGVTVVVGVLVLGSELSKRDRAELHGQAEKAGGVASSSHGVGGGRFLSLTCSLANRTGAVELELSAEQAELARRLFRLAQQEYHSRYECLSHREIREVVFRGGPSAKDHPDLFRLMERHRQKQSDKDGPPTKGKRSGNARSGNASTNKATAGGNPGSAPPAATRGASPDQSGGVGATSDQKNQRLNGVDDGVAQSAAAVLLPPSGGSRADEEVPPPFSVR